MESLTWTYPDAVTCAARVLHLAPPLIYLSVPFVNSVASVVGKSIGICVPQVLRKGSCMLPRAF